MSSQRRVVTEWDEEEQAEEIGSPTLGTFGRNFAAALWPIAVMAVVCVAVIVWAVMHYS